MKIAKTLFLVFLSEKVQANFWATFEPVSGRQVRRQREESRWKPTKYRKSPKNRYSLKHMENYERNENRLNEMENYFLQFSRT